MRYTSLGRSGLQVSRLALGTMNFGELTDQPAAFQIMDAAIDAGINFFDTADVYGGPQRPDMEKGYGTSEEIIGRWLAQGGRRDRIVLATKLYQPMGTGPNDRHLSAYHIRRACEDSLRRLQTDHIDLYQMHHVDRRTPWDEIWQAMEQLVREGKITYIGSSNFAGWDIATGQSVASSRHFLGLTSEQSLYNLSARTTELEVIPALRYYGIGLIPWSPIGMGLLGGVLRKASEGRRASPLLQMRIDQHRQQLEKYEALCQQIGEEPAVVALAWLLQNPSVTAPIVGPRTREQLTSTLHALEVSFLRKRTGVWTRSGPAPAVKRPRPTPGRRSERRMNLHKTNWPAGELRKIGETDDLHISPFREDGVTYGTPTWIWSVVVDDALYVRGYNGRQSRWYQAAIRQKAGRIRAAGMTKDVVFEPIDGAINDRIDDAYRAKYARSPFLKPMISAGARAATVRVSPRG